MIQFLFGLFLSSPVHAAPLSCLTVLNNSAQQKSVIIKASPDVSAESIAKLQNTANQAVQFFQTHFGEVDRSLTINVGSGLATLQTGYDHDTETINFPPNTKIENYGLNSDDVILHEVFHALLCKAFPSACTKANLTDPASVSLHEALADYFTFKLRPDSCFGENYYINQPYLRVYRNQRSVSLSSGTHNQSNAIAAYLIRHDLQLKVIKSFLERGEFNLAALGEFAPALKVDFDKDAQWELDEVIQNYPVSSSRRYRLSEGKPLVLSFKPNDFLKNQYPDLSYSFESEGRLDSGFTITQIDKSNFSIEVGPEAKSQRFTLIISAGGALIGERHFYLGRAFNK